MTRGHRRLENSLKGFFSKVTGDHLQWSQWHFQNRDYPHLTNSCPAKYQRSLKYLLLEPSGSTTQWQMGIVCLEPCQEP